MVKQNQAWLLVTVGIIAAILFAALAVYFGAAADAHPRVKHVLLFGILTVLALLVAWFSYPKRTT